MMVLPDVGMGDRWAKKPQMQEAQILKIEFHPSIL
jgi:hypothetical protein